MLKTINAVPFDPTMFEHRMAAHIYFQTGSWAHTRLRFELAPGQLSVPHSVAESLAKHYLSQEFPKSNIQAGDLKDYLDSPVVDPTVYCALDSQMLEDGFQADIYESENE